MLRRKAADEKVVFSITVQEVTLKKVERGFDKDPVSILLERGKKTFHTPDKVAKIAANGDATVSFSDAFQLDATLHTEKGQFAEKVARLVVRRKKKGMMGASYVEIGQVVLPLHALVSEEMPLSRTMVMEKSPFPGSQMKLIIDCQFSEVRRAAEEPTGGRAPCCPHRFPMPAHSCLPFLCV